MKTETVIHGALHKAKADKANFADKALEALGAGDKKKYTQLKSQYDQAQGFITALSEALQPSEDTTPHIGWFAYTERKPSANGFYLVFGCCTGGVMPSQDLAEYDAGEGKFNKSNQPTHWRHLPPPPPNA